MLERLSVSRCALSERGVQALVSTMRHLISLDLAWNPVGDAGARALAVAPLQRTLDFLDCSSCGIGDAGAQALLTAPFISSETTLLLWGNRISRRMRQRLKRRFGLCVRGL